KLSLPAPAEAPRALTAIAVLRCDGGTGVATKPLHGAVAHLALGGNAYRGAYLRALWEAEMFAWASEVASAVPVYEITRPAEGWTVDAVADAVEAITRQMPSAPIRRSRRGASTTGRAASAGTPGASPP